MDAEHAQFPVYARGTPQKVVQIQATDQAACFSIDGRPAELAPLPTPSPPGTPTPAPPPQDGLRLDDFECLRPTLPTIRQHHPKDSICRRKVWAFKRAIKDCDLLAQRKDLKQQIPAFPQSLSDSSNKPVDRLKHTVTMAQVGEKIKEIRADDFSVTTGSAGRL